MLFVRKLLKWVLLSSLIGFTLLFALISGGMNPIINSQTARIERLVSQSLHRPFSLSHVDLRAFPNVVLELDGVALGEREGSSWAARSEELPSSFLKLSKVELRFKLWRAITSLGQDLELEAMNLDGLQLVLHRNREGRWNFEDRANEQGEPQALPQELDSEPASEPVSSSDEPPLVTKAEMSPEELARSRRELKQLLRSLKLSDVGFKELKVTLIDELGVPEGEKPRVLQLAELNLRFPRLELTDVIEGSLSAELLAERENFSVDFKIGSMAEWFKRDEESSPTELEALEEVPFPISISLKADELSFEPLKPYLSQDRPARLEQLSLDGELSLFIDPAGELKIGGAMRAKGLQLREGPKQAWGPELQAELRPALRVSLRDDQLSLEGFSVALNDMKLELGGELSNLESEMPTFKGLKLITEGLSFERLLGALPPLRSQLPPGAQLSGPIALSVETSGDPTQQSVALLFDLSGAQLEIPEQLSKPAGVPVKLSLDALVSPQLITLKSIEAQLSDLALKLKGQVKPQSNAVSLKGGASAFSINNIARLAPSVRAALPPEVSVAGQASLELDIQSAVDALNVELSAQLSGCQLNTPEAKLIGDGRAELKVSGDPQSALQVSVLSDLKGLTILAGEAFNKPAGTPLDLALELSVGPNLLKIPKLEAHVASLDLVGVGQQVGERFELKAALKPSPLGPVIALAPSASRGLSEGLKRARLGFELQVQAGQSPEDLELRLQDLSFKTPKSELKGALSFKQPSTPVIDLQLRSPRLDLDELAPPSAEAEPPTSAQAAEATSAEGSAEPPALTFTGSVQVKRGVARGVSFKDLIAELSVHNSLVKVKSLQVDVFKGQVRAAPLSMKLPSDEGAHFEGDFALSGIDLEEALKQLSAEQPSKKSVAGRLDAKLTLKGEGRDQDELLSTLSGQGSTKLARGVLYGLDPEAGIYNALAKKLPGVKRKRSRPLKLKTLQGEVEVKGGAIHFKEPLELETDQGPLSVDGSLGFNLEAALEAVLKLDPKRVSRQLGRPVQHKGPIEVPFKVSGPLSEPKMSGVGLAALVAVAAVALGGGEALKAAEALKSRGREALNEGKRGAKRALKRSKRRAERELKRAESRAREEAEAARRSAQAKRDEAQRKAKAEADKAKREAQRAKDQAKREAKSKAQEAKKKLKGLF